MQLLSEILAALEDRADVRDGSDGRQLPNEAMVLLEEFGPRLRAAIASASQGD